MSSATDAATRAAARSGFLPGRIVHVHPTRLCNLACAHCYSESDPGQRAAIDPGPLCDALTLLQAEGYRQISLSGGEPLVYPALGEVVQHARSLGLRVTMITNGLLATERADPLIALMDGVAISFDGLAPTHDALRGRPDAFARAAAALQRLAARGVPVSAALSITREGIGDLPDLADHLVSLGARGLQIRPVARAGRARGLDAGLFFSEADALRLFLVTQALRQELPESVRVHCDLAPAQGLWQQRDSYVGLLGQCDVATGALPHDQRPLADLVNPLVITEMGTLKPIAYDFHRRYDIASVNGLSAAALQRYKRERLPALQALVGGALAGLQGQHRMVDWFDLCARSSETLAARQIPLVPA